MPAKALEQLQASLKATDKSALDAVAAALAASSGFEALKKKSGELELSLKQVNKEFTLLASLSLKETEKELTKAQKAAKEFETTLEELGKFTKALKDVTGAAKELAKAYEPFAKEGSKAVQDAIGDLEELIATGEKIAELSGLVWGLVKASRALAGALAANPFGALVAALVAAGAGLNLLITKMKEADQEYLNQIAKANELSGAFFALSQAKGFVAEEDVEAGKRALEQLEAEQEDYQAKVDASTEKLGEMQEELEKLRSDETPTFGGGFTGLSGSDVKEIGLLSQISKEKKSLEEFDLSLREATGRIFMMKRAFAEVEGKPKAAADEIDELTEKLRNLMTVMGRQRALLGQFRNMLQGGDLGLDEVADVDLLQGAFQRVNQLSFDPGELSRMLEMVRGTLAQGGGAAEVEALLQAFERMSELKVGLGTEEGRRILQETQGYAAQKVEVDALVDAYRNQIEVRENLLPVLAKEAELSESLKGAFAQAGADFSGLEFLGEALGSIGDLDPSGQVEVIGRLAAQLRELDPASEKLRAVAEGLEQLTSASGDPADVAAALGLLIDQATKGELGAEQIRSLASALSQLEDLGSGLDPSDLAELLEVIRSQAESVAGLEELRAALEDLAKQEAEAAAAKEAQRKAREEFLPALELERDLLQKLAAELDKGEEAASGLEFLSEAFEELAASEILPEDKLEIFDELLSQVEGSEVASEQVKALAESFRDLTQSGTTPEQQISALERLIAAAGDGELAAAQIRTLAEALLRLGNIDPESELGKQITGAAEELGAVLEDLESRSEETSGKVNEHWQGFVDGIASQFNSALSDLFKGSTEGFENLFKNIGDMFADMLADMVTKWLQSKLFQQGGGANFGGFTQQFNVNPTASGGLGAAGWGNVALLGAGVGSMVGGNLVGGDPTVSAVFGAAGAAAGVKIGMMIGAIGGPVGMFVGALLGGIVGGLIGGVLSKKPSPRGYAELALRDGMVMIESLRTRGKANVQQLKKFATGAAEAVNELAQLTGGTLTSIPDITLETKKNKYFRVIDESGIVHKFDEDMEAAIDYAVTQILKNAEFEGLSEEVEAALKNTRATTVEGLKSDIEFATAIRDIDLDPVTRDLRKVIEAFNGMRDRARQLGISLDKVDTAFSNAVNELKEKILSDLKSFEEMGLTDVEREARRITEAFDEMRENARLFNDELTREKDARNEQIAALQKQLEEQERLQEMYERLSGLELPDLPEFDDEFGIRGRFDRPDFANLAEEAGEEIARLMDEIARLMGLNADQQLIDLERIEEAERQARAALRERVRDSLAQFRFSNLTPVQQQLRQLSATFEKLRRDARAAGVPMGEVNSALAAAREAIRKQVLDRLQPFEDAAQGLTPLEVELRNLRDTFDEIRTDAAELGISLERVDAAFEAAVESLRERLRDELQGYVDQGENPVVVQLRQLDERFAELRESAEALGVSLEEVDAAHEAAVESLRRQVRDELQSFADAGANPFVVQLRELRERFAELRESAEALGISMEEVNAAYEAALAAQQAELRDSIQGFLDYGAGLTDLQIRHRDLTQFFQDQIEAARALDEAMGTTGAGGGPGENERLVLEAQAAAFQQLVDEFNASLQDLRDAGMSPVEIALRDMRDRFAELRANAELLGISIAELTRLEQEAIDRMKADLQASLDKYLLSDEERAEKALEEEFLGYLRDALAIYSYEPGEAPEKEELFPAASELEASFLSIVQVATELKAAFEGVTATLSGAKPGAVATKPLPTGPPEPEPPPPPPPPSASELVLSAVGGLQDILSGQGLEDLSPEASGEITSAAADLNVLLQQLRLGITDDIPAVQEALGNFVTLLQENGVEVGDSLLALVDALASTDAGTFLQDLADQLDLTGDGFSALIDALLSGGLTLPELMQDLANGVFDAIQAILGDISPELAEALQNIGKAWLEANKGSTGGGRARPRGASDARREAEQFQRDREALEKQLEQFEDLTLTATERELKSINEQFDEMRKNARRLRIPLERVEEAYRIAIDEQKKALEDQLAPFAELGLTPVEQEVRRLNQQFEELAKSAELLGIPPERVEEARQAALGQQRKTVEQQLAPFEQLGLAPVEQEVRRLNEQFDELARSAEAVGISAERVEAARQAALDQQRELVEQQLVPFEELGLTPVEQEVRRLNEQFDELARSAEAVGISSERVEAARQAALDQQRRAVEQQLVPFEELGLTPVEREIRRLNEQFDELARSAEAVGISSERVEAARQAALDQQREAVEQQLAPFEEIGLSSVELELRRLDEQFEELARSAEAVGISSERVEAAYEAALQQQRDALAEQLRPYEELGLSAGERELAQLNEQFDEIRANAELLGFSLERVDAAYQAAIEDFWERTLQPIRDFKDSLTLSDLSPLTPEERLEESRRRFDELAAAALGGDFDAIQALPDAAQALLDEGQSFFASGQGFQDIFALVQDVLDEVLAGTPNAEGLGEQVAAGAAGLTDSVDDLYAATGDNLRQMTTVIDEDLTKVSETFDGLMAVTGRGVLEIAAALDRNVRRVLEYGGATGELIRGIADGSYRPFFYVGDEEPAWYPPVVRPPEGGDGPVSADAKRDDTAVVEELRLSRETGHADAAVLHADSVALHKKLEDQAEEIRELRALMRRVTSRMEFGRRA